LPPSTGVGPVFRGRNDLAVHLDAAGEDFVSLGLELGEHVSRFLGLRRAAMIGEELLHGADPLAVFVGGQHVGRGNILGDFLKRREIQFLALDLDDIGFRQNPFVLDALGDFHFNHVVGGVLAEDGSLDGASVLHDERVGKGWKCG
jgi:hypothetical protein